MGCGGDCGCPQCEGRVPPAHPSVGALDWGLLAGKSRPGASDFWAAATTRTVFNSAVAGMPDTDEVRTWVDDHAFATAEQSASSDTRYSNMLGAFGRPPLQPTPLPSWPRDDDPPAGPGPLPPPPRPGGKEPGWLTRNTWSYERFGVPPHASFAWNEVGSNSQWGRGLRTGAYRGLLLDYDPRVAWTKVLKRAANFAFAYLQGKLRPLLVAVAEIAPWMLPKALPFFDDPARYKGACCLRHMSGFLTAIGTTTRSWKGPAHQKRASGTLKAGFRATEAENNPHLPPCKCNCCAYRQFISARTVYDNDVVPPADRVRDEGKRLLDLAKTKGSPYTEVDLIRAPELTSPPCGAWRMCGSQWS